METSDWHLQTIMKNDFPIKNFQNFIDQVRKLGYNLLSAILVTAELVGKYIVILHNIGLKALRQAPEKGNH